MGVGFKVGGSAVFKSFVTVQANPSAVVTLTLGSLVYNAQADSNGVANFTVKKKGTYTVTSNNTASYQAENNTSTINVNKSNRSFTGQMVKLNIPAALSSGNYSSNVLSLYWTRPSSNWTGCDLRWHGTTYPTTRTAGTSLAKGAGGNLVLTNTSTVNGYNHSGLTANSTYYYSIFSYITINGTDYWATAYRSTSGKAINYVGTVVTITSTRTWSVPTGWRTAKAFVVGGGGGGNQGGGGGGYTKTSGNFSVTPGSSYTVTIGGGGAANGGRGGTTSFGSVVSAAGGYGGGTTLAASGGNGGSGGGAYAIYRDPHYYDSNGTAGGSDGASAKSNTYYTGAANAHTFVGGTGQGSTTRAWGSSSGTLYAGGGGGGGKDHSGGGAGGNGGGGAGSSSYSTAGTNGTANTGGGGGGGAYSSSSESRSNGGSGGSGIALVQCVA